MTPTRVTPPDAPVVALEDLKAHLRVDHDDDDVLIAALEMSAVAHLDGWRGVLGRAIREQQWAVTYDQAGRYRLPLPDVSAVSAVDAEGESVEVRFCSDSIGAKVFVSAPATVTFTAALPEDLLPVVVMAIKLLVGHWYEHRETVITGTISTT